MERSLIDLSYLARFCKDDRARMERYVNMYLQGSPEMFRTLLIKLDSDDAEGLAGAAHSLRPQVNYMGAQAIFDLLTTIEAEAKANGAAACSAIVHECNSLNDTVHEELRAWLAAGAS